MDDPSVADRTRHLRAKEYPGMDGEIQVIAKANGIKRDEAIREIIRAGIRVLLSRGASELIEEPDESSTKSDDD